MKPPPLGQPAAAAPCRRPSNPSAHRPDLLFWRPEPSPSKSAALPGRIQCSGGRSSSPPDQTHSPLPPLPEPLHRRCLRRPKTGAGGENWRSKGRIEGARRCRVPAGGLHGGCRCFPSARSREASGTLLDGPECRCLSGREFSSMGIRTDA
ncbi:hypothetical protein GQ55_2G242500 [Panicum hallii var. hallii]|uniref:Uncharacterized protein n=1 Tax=Panicum hallii var. hallii TaxID=1504633 RepID=A0A2T7ERW7_9POAL|nr:hypothetical protein GQ55_2G242500 [Panicum hallii var. hallii]